MKGEGGTHVNITSDQKVSGRVPFSVHHFLNALTDFNNVLFAGAGVAREGGLISLVCVCVHHLQLTSLILFSPLD